MFLKKIISFPEAQKVNFFVIGPERELIDGEYSLNYYGLTVQVLFVQVLFGAERIFQRKHLPSPKDVCSFSQRKGLMYLPSSKQYHCSMSE